MYGALTAAYLGLDRVDEAASIANKALAVEPDSPATHTLRYVVASAQDDSAGMQRELKWASNAPAGESDLLILGALQSTKHGQLRHARELLAQNLAANEAGNLKEIAAQAAATGSYIEATLGETQEAQRQAVKSLALARTRTNLPTLAVTLALLGEDRKSESMVEELNRKYPLDTLIQSVYIPCSKAVGEAHRKSFSRAVDLLRPAARYELGAAIEFLPIYVRGLIYLEANQTEDAITEFQKIVNHHNLAPFAPEHALALVQLGRAFVQQGDNTKARTAYQDFLALWKDADPDIPILKQAKAEYAKLQ